MLIWICFGGFFEDSFQNSFGRNLIEIATNVTSHPLWRILLTKAKIMLSVSEGLVISPPLSSLTLYGGDITPFLEHYGGGGGFPPRGWYPPLVPIWPWATGVTRKLCLFCNGCSERIYWEMSLFVWVKIIAMLSTKPCQGSSNPPHIFRMKITCSSVLSGSLFFRPS